VKTPTGHGTRPNFGPLVYIAEAEFGRLLDDAHAAVNRLCGFWTRLYGPNENDTQLRAILNAMCDEFYENDSDE